MIKVLSLSAGPDTKLSANFRVREFACKDGADLLLVAEELIQRLQALREVLGKPVNINSAYRTVSHNKKVGGQTLSTHLAGLAADIVVSGTTPAAVAAAAETIGFRGIGLYDTFVHVDVRTKRVLWDKRGGTVKYVSTLGGDYPDAAATDAEIPVYMHGDQVVELAGKLIDGTTYLPARMIAEALGCRVDWQPGRVDVWPAK